MIFTIIQNIFSLSTFIVLHIIIPFLYGMLITTFVANVGSLLWQYAHYWGLGLYSKMKYECGKQSPMDQYYSHQIQLKRFRMLRNIKEHQERLTNWRKFFMVMSDPISDILAYLVQIARDSENTIEKRLETRDNVEHFCSFLILTCLLFNIKSLVFCLDSFHAVFMEKSKKFKQRHTLKILMPSNEVVVLAPRGSGKPQAQNLNPPSPHQEEIREPEHRLAQPQSLTASSWIHQFFVREITDEHTFAERTRIRVKNAMRALSRKGRA
jgi:hypothetical protein